MKVWSGGMEGGICGKEFSGKGGCYIWTAWSEVFTEEGIKLRQPERFLPGQRKELVGFGSRQMSTVMGRDWSEVEQ